MERLRKWSRIHPKIYFRERVLVINNLVPSRLWHKLSCVDPPTGLLPKLQSILVNLFWDKLHWMPQSVLYLPIEEGGQGMVHLQSRFRIFLMDFKSWYGERQLEQFCKGWKVLVWMLPFFKLVQRNICLNGLPSFYHGLFKVWRLFFVHRLEKTCSLFIIENNYL